MKCINYLCFVLLVVGCTTTTKITSIFKEPKAAVRKYNKILVLGIARQKENNLLEKVERHFVGDLTKLGYHAISAVQEFSPGTFDRLDEKDAVQKIKSKGVDAVITVVLLVKEKKKRPVSGHIIYTPSYHYYDRFSDYTITLYNKIYEPGYYVTDTKYYWESNLYDMNDQSLIYSVQTTSFSPLKHRACGAREWKNNYQKYGKRKNITATRNNAGLINELFEGERNCPLISY